MLVRFDDVPASS